MKDISLENTKPCQSATNCGRRVHEESSSDECMLCRRRARRGNKIRRAIENPDQFSDRQLDAIF